MSFDLLWKDIAPLGRDQGTGGYKRYAWTDADAQLRDWFATEAGRRGLDLTQDRAGNQWAWWGDPDAAVRAGNPGVVIGSHLDSVPDGGAFDGPLGVVSAFAAVDALREQGFQPRRPIGVVNFCDEEGARFGIACAGSRIITGALAPERALALADVDGVSMAQALRHLGRDPGQLGPDRETLARVGNFVELHVEQGRELAALDRPVAVGSAIWPHGRWLLRLMGQANHAGTTRLIDRHDPMLALAAVILAAREQAAARSCVATIGKVLVTPNGVNAIASEVSAWLDARGPVEADVRAVATAVANVGATAVAAAAGATAAMAAGGLELAELSFTGETPFDPVLAARLAALLADAPVLATGAGHDAGILANAGISTAMLFVRNPSGISHSPAEFAERDDCLAGVTALTAVVAELAGPGL